MRALNALWSGLTAGLVFSTAGLLAAAEAPATFAVSEFTFTRPASWGWVISRSSMRKAQLQIPDAKGGAGAEVVFFHFGPSDGGGVQANVDRWLAQFEEPREKLKSTVEKVRVRGRAVTYVQGEGTLRAGVPGGPATASPGYALAGAIIEDPKGSVFIKLTGPKALVDGARAEFKTMVEGAIK